MAKRTWRRLGLEQLVQDFGGASDEHRTAHAEKLLAASFSERIDDTGMVGRDSWAAHPRKAVARGHVAKLDAGLVLESAVTWLLLARLIAGGPPFDRLGGPLLTVNRSGP